MIDFLVSYYNHEISTQAYVYQKSIPAVSSILMTDESVSNETTAFDDYDHDIVNFLDSAWNHNVVVPNQSLIRKRK